MSTSVRCDWCGKPIDFDTGDVLTTVDEEELEDEEYDLSGQDVADGIAEALEVVGTPKDAMLADSIRENVGWVLHRRCEKESALDEIMEDVND